MYPYFLLAALMQEGAPSASSSRIPLLSDCASDSEAVGFVQPGDPISVRSARAGESPTCYSVTVRTNGKELSGYILGNPGIPAIAEFERQLHQVVPVPPRTPAAAVPPPATHVSNLRKFPNFSGLDTKQRRVSLSAVDAKLILVCYWSPRNAESSRELIEVTRLFNLLHKEGVTAIGIALGQYEEITGAMDDFGTNFPNIPDRSGLVERAGLAFETLPRTYILNRQHEILASGLHKQELEAAVHRFLREQ